MIEDRYVFENDGSCEPHYTYRGQIEIEETYERDRRTSNPMRRLRTGERERRSEREPERERERGRQQRRSRERIDYDREGSIFSNKR